MSRATLISRVVFGVLVLATLTAFFVAQRLKRSDPLVYAVNVKRYVSPNGDGLGDRARIRFRTKRRDAVTVDVVDRSGDVVRTLADRRPMGAGPHNLRWDGRFAPSAGANLGRPAPDGAYRVRIEMRRSGRTFTPDKYFVVDTAPPRLRADVVGAHALSVAAVRPRAVTVRFSGVEPSRRVEFLVFRVRGGRTLARPVAAFVNARGRSFGQWPLTVGEYRRRREPCDGKLKTSGRARPAPPGAYVIVVRACDAARNVGLSTTSLPPRRGTTTGRPGVTLRGVQIAPPVVPVAPGRVARFAVNPPAGGYRYRLRAVAGGVVAAGADRGAVLAFRMPSTPPGLYELAITARRRASGDRGVARTPVVVSGGRGRALLVAYPAIAWQANNPVDVDGDGYGDPFTALPPGRELRVSMSRTLADPGMPQGYFARERPLAGFLAQAGTPPAAQTTDYALAANPDSALARRKAVLFAGDERWITPQLGAALRRFVAGGGRVAFFAPQAFRRTVRLDGTQMTGPSALRGRDIFGEASELGVEEPAPVIAFTDKLGLLSGPTGLFTTFEQSRGRVRAGAALTTAGRDPGRPALVAYRYGKGLAIRVGIDRWQAQLVGAAAQPSVQQATRRIVEELLK